MQTLVSLIEICNCVRLQVMLMYVVCRHPRLLENAGRSRGRGQQPHEPQCTLTMGKPTFTLTVYLLSCCLTHW